MSMISELVKELRWIADYEYQSRSSEGTIRKAADTIEMLSEKVREPKQGEWIEHEWAEEVEGLLISNYECSECHSWERSKSNFCPNCGARMKGADDEIS